MSTLLTIKITSFLSHSEQEGRQSIANRVKSGELIITFTEKDFKVVVCKQEVYVEAVKVLLDKDEKVEWSVLQPTKKLTNRTLTKLASIFSIGEAGTSSQTKLVWV